jgi:Cd2+/Zn2+-exporting ATPase
VIESQAQSAVVIGHKRHAGCLGEVLGVLAVADLVRPHAAEAVRLLRETGIRHVIMLSGDNQRTVDAVARQVGLDQAEGDLLPDAKLQRVRQLMAQHRHVGMIGDGVNDAPAMAAASVGIAMGKAGTDTAIEAADMTLMNDDLSAAADAILLGRRTLRVIQVNIAFAIGTKAVFLALALSGHTSLWLAILADTGATLLVAVNSLGLSRYSRPDDRLATRKPLESGN